MTKRCFKCHRDLPRSEFYRHKMMGDGLLGKCKDCTKKDVKDRYDREHERVIEYDRSRNKDPMRNMRLIWGTMIRRCHYPSNPSYKSYGARGIQVCDRWRESFDAFLSDVGMRPSRCHSLDRYPNNNGNYEPGNVRWATATEQARNRRSNRILEYNGERLCAAEWAERLGIPLPLLNTRLSRGWDIQRIHREIGQRRTI